MIHFRQSEPPPIPKEVAVCPICHADLIIDDIDEWSDSGRVTECGLHIQCTSEPDIDTAEWKPWFDWHYRMPYVDWLPVETLVYRWFDARYRMIVEITPELSVERPRFAKLSLLERRVVVCVAEGLNNSEIAQFLRLSIYTIRSGVMGCIYQKTGFYDRTQLAIYAWSGFVPEGVGELP